MVRDDNTLEMREVNVVRSDIENVYIKDSLKDGERISLTTINNMATGQMVKVIGEEEKPQSLDQDEESQQTLVAAGEQ